jgi:hypothetical protein
LKSARLIRFYMESHGELSSSLLPAR